MAGADPKILQRIAEGHFAGIALDVMSDLLTKLQETSLTRADELRLAGKLTPETSYALLYELGAYRTILNRLRQKVQRAETARAAAEASPATPPNGDGSAAAEETE